MPRSWLQRLLGLGGAKRAAGQPADAFAPDPLEVIRRRAEMDAAGGLGGLQPVPAGVPADFDMDPVVEMRSSIERNVAAGFMARDQIIDMAMEVMEAEAGGADLRLLAERITDEALAAHMVAQATWPARTDCDRLDAAFAELEAEGVIARHDFTCCSSCGAAEIWDEIDAARNAGLPARGYAFYHQQDTERAVEGGGLYLNYGSCEEGPEEAVAVGRQIVKRLEDHGVQAHWDGRIETRIAVPLDWKRRREGRVILH